MPHPSLLDPDREIIAALYHNPRQSPTLLAESVESTDRVQSIRNRLQVLLDQELVHRPARGIYALTTKGERAATRLDAYNEDRASFWTQVES